MEDLKMTSLWLAYDWTCQHTQGKVHIRLSTCRVASHSCLISSNPFTSKACPTPPSRSRSNAQDPRKHQLWQLLKVASTWTWPTSWWYKIRGNSYKSALISALLFPKLRFTTPGELSSQANCPRGRLQVILCLLTLSWFKWRRFSERVALPNHWIDVDVDQIEDQIVRIWNLQAVGRRLWKKIAQKHCHTSKNILLV